jgi:hypothetical protein
MTVHIYLVLWTRTLFKGTIIAAWTAMHQSCLYPLTLALWVQGF